MIPPKLHPIYIASQSYNPTHQTFQLDGKTYHRLNFQLYFNTELWCFSSVFIVTSYDSPAGMKPRVDHLAELVNKDLIAIPQFDKSLPNKPLRYIVWKKVQV